MYKKVYFLLFSFTYCLVDRNKLDQQVQHIKNIYSYYFLVSTYNFMIKKTLNFKVQLKKRLKLKHFINNIFFSRLNVLYLYFQKYLQLLFSF